MVHDGIVNSADINRLNWDERAPAHAASPGYHVDRFIQDPAFLSYVVQFDVPRLGDISGLRGVHLQCHIGTDTISLARLGARMTGLDFSPAALIEARRIADYPILRARVFLGSMVSSIGPITRLFTSER